jgi:hypothetical protein
LKHGSIHNDEALVKFVNAITSEDWRTTIVAFLRGHFIPEDEKEEKRWPFGPETTPSSVKAYIERGCVHHSSNAYPGRRQATSQ